jgi:hypothetical protein
MPLTFAAPPSAGDLSLEVGVAYQAWSDVVPLPPASFTTRFIVKEVAMAERSLPPRPAV